MAINVRTPEELADINFNYYNAFKIDLNEKDSKVIASKINNICNTKANSSDPVSVRLGKDLKKDAIEVLANDAVYDERTGTYTPNKGGRTKEAAAFKKLKLEPIIQFLVSLCERGIIYKSEVKQVADKNKMTVEEIEAGLKNVLRGGVKYVDDTQNRFDFHTYNEIDKYLKGLDDSRITNLYELLDLPITSDLRTIRAQLDAYKQRDANKTSLKKGIGPSLKQLYGCADTVFKEEGDKDNTVGRIQYKKFLQIKNDVYLPLKARSDNGIVVIRAEDYLKYLDLIAKNTGCKLDVAEEDLGAILKALNLKLSSDSSIGDKAQIELCPYDDCGKPYIVSANTNICPHCGKPLTVLCWNCQSPVRFSTKTVVCSKCSLTDKMQSVFQKNIDEIGTLLKNPRTPLTTLKTALNKLKSTVPGYEKMPTSEVAKKVAFFDSEITAKDKAEESMLKQYREMIADVDKFIITKQLYKAEAKIKEIARVLPGYNANDIESYNSKIASGLSKSKQYLDNAKRAQATGNVTQAISFSAKALEECADNLEAQQILKKFPPTAPQNVRCRVGDEGKVSIEWDIVGEHTLVNYVVVRKVGFTPTSTSDGTPIAKNLTLNYSEDSNVVAATKCYYGVFAERFGVQTAIAVCNTPVLILRNIVNFRQEMTEGKIHVKWNCPSNVKRIDVRKQAGAKPAENGSVFSDVNSEGFIDDKCGNEGNSYFVKCVYEIDGKEISSSGTQMFFKPVYFPKTITDLRIKQQSGGLCELTARNVDKDMKLYCSAEKLAVPIKKVEKREVLSRGQGMAKVISPFDNGDGTYGFNLPSNFTGYIYAVNLNEQLFNASAPLFITSLNGISNVKYTENSGTLKITCNIAPEITEIIVLVKNDNFADSIDEKGDSFKFSADKTRTDGGMTLKLRADTVSYVTLFAKIKGTSNTEIALCAPIRLPDAIDYRKKQIVKYAIQYEGSPSKPFMVTVKFEADVEIKLPDFVIVKGSPRPLNKNAGELVEKFNGGQLKKGMLTHGKYVGKVTIKLPPMGKMNKLAMFFADDGAKNIQMKEVINL